MGKLANLSLVTLRQQQEEIEEEIERRDLEQENEELRAKIARLENHVIATDKENAVLKSMMGYLRES